MPPTERDILHHPFGLPEKPATDHATAPPPIDPADPRPAHPNELRPLTLTLNCVQAGAVWELYATGLFGTTIEETALRLLDESLRRARGEGWWLPNA